LAAHLAFIAAASRARPSGERLSLLFAFLTVPGFFAAAVARAADFLAAFSAFAASAASSFRLNLASFCGPSRTRFSSRLIFFLKFFSFMICPPARDEGEFAIRFTVNDKISLMSPSYHEEKICTPPREMFG
jgi:hypothetical protein